MSPATLPQNGRGAFVEAWSETAGPDGEMWHLVVEETGEAEVSYWTGPGASPRENRFLLSQAQRDAIRMAIREAQFHDLAESLGPERIPLHGPSHSLAITLDERARRVDLYQPADATGTAVERFRRVWRAVVAASPISRPSSRETS
jgi:hypothetical protein